MSALIVSELLDKKLSFFESKLKHTRAHQDALRGELSAGSLSAEVISAAVHWSKVAASGRKTRKLEKAQFCKDVIEHLNAAYKLEQPGSTKKVLLVWCHLTGWQQPELVKAAHIVPKYLHGDELVHLFGDKEIVLSSPLNGKSNSLLCKWSLDIAKNSLGLTLFNKIEEAYLTVVPLHSFLFFLSKQRTRQYGSAFS